MNSELKQVYDITPRISSCLAVWPGDTPPSRELLLDRSIGASVTLSTLRATVHLGAHADAPNHYGTDADAIDKRSLHYYLGACQVMQLCAPRAVRVTHDMLPDPITTPRVLIATGTYPDPAHFNQDFAAFSPDLIDRLHAQGVITIGIDTPSIDLFDSKDLPAHRAVLRNDMAILEGLVLREVPPGTYELIALPLPLEGFDASPVRAVLRQMKNV